MLFGKADFRGKLSFSWPADAAGRAAQRRRCASIEPLYPYGYGLTLQGPVAMRALSEDPGIALDDRPTGPLFARGRAVGARLLQIDGANDSPQTITGAADNGALAVRPVDRDAQEDARELTWSGRSRGHVAHRQPAPGDLTDAGPLALEIAVQGRSRARRAGRVEVACGPGCSARIDVTHAHCRARRAGLADAAAAARLPEGRSTCRASPCRSRSRPPARCA